MERAGGAQAAGQVVRGDGADRPADPQRAAAAVVADLLLIAMSASTEAGAAALPEILPIFPLPCVLLLPLLSGYRRVRPDWAPFARDLDPDEAADFDRARLVRGLRNFFTQQGLKADWEAIEKAPVEGLVTSIAMLCPFPSREKQALLEA